MKKWFLIGCGGVLGIWLITIFTLLPALEAELQLAGTQLLQEHQTEGKFKDVKLTFSGQQANLGGLVRSEAERLQVEKLIASDVRNSRGWGRSYNPVLAVNNTIVIEPASMPVSVEPWIMAVRYMDQLHLSGVVSTAQLSAKIEKSFRDKAKGGELKIRNSLQLVRDTNAAEMELDPTLASIPNLEAQNKEPWIAVTSLDGQWHILPGTANNEEVVNQLVKAHPEVSLVELGLKDFRLWKVAEDEKQRLAALSPPPVIQPSTPATADLFPSLSTAAYIGWLTDGKSVQLFGKVPNQLYKQSVIQSAITAFAGLTINSSRLVINDKTTLQEQSPVKFQTFSLPARPRVGIVVPGRNSRTYPADVFDSEIIRDFPEVAFSEGEISGHLDEFRFALVKDGLLEPENPFLTMIWNGDSLTLLGEVDSAPTHDTILTVIEKAYPDRKFVDKLTISSLVKPSHELDKTLAVLPEIPANSTGIATARPGQPWRTSVVHAVYFKIGSDRSKDQERALYQIRRILALNNEARFEVVGHTDNTGAEDMNLKLSQERAEKFVQYLVANGIDPALLTSRGAGSSAPISDNKTEPGKALNRRVDVLLK